MAKQKIFFDFLYICIGFAKEIPDSLKEEDWKEQDAIVQKILVRYVLINVLCIKG